MGATMVAWVCNRCYSRGPLVSEPEACDHCGAAEWVPAASPRGREILERSDPDSLPRRSLQRVGTLATVLLLLFLVQAVDLGLSLLNYLARAQPATRSLVP